VKRKSCVSKPWVLGILINEGVKLRKRETIGLTFFTLYTTHIIVLKIFLFAPLELSKKKKTRILG
jgi:hypothetical protein